MNLPDDIRPDDMHWMAAALEMARNALDQGEFPVGCVIADGSRKVATGSRTGTAGNRINEIDHAEINALRALSTAVPHADPARLTLYCTLEPCLMCFSAILLSRIPRIVYAYEDVMGGGARWDRTPFAPLYRDATITIVSGVMRKESLLLFKRFFSNAGNTYWKNSLLSRYALAQKIDG